MNSKRYDQISDSEQNGGGGPRWQNYLSTEDFPATGKCGKQESPE